MNFVIVMVVLMLITMSLEDYNPKQLPIIIQFLILFASFCFSYIIGCVLIGVVIHFHFPINIIPVIIITLVFFYCKRNKFNTALAECHNKNIAIKILKHFSLFFIVPFLYIGIVIGLILIPTFFGAIIGLPLVMISGAYLDIVHDMD